jgi:hypothetical protein
MRYKKDPLVVAKELWFLKDQGNTAKYISLHHADKIEVGIVRKLLKMRDLSSEVLSVIEIYHVGWDRLDLGGKNSVLRLSKEGREELTREKIIKIAQLDNIEQIGEKQKDDVQNVCDDVQKLNVAVQGGCSNSGNIIKFPGNHQPRDGGSPDAEKSEHVARERVQRVQKSDHEVEQDEVEHAQEKVEQKESEGNKTSTSTETAPAPRQNKY